MLSDLLDRGILFKLQTIEAIKVFDPPGRCRVWMIHHARDHLLVAET